MAAAVATASAVDLRAPSSYPVRLGASITGPDGSNAYSTVRYNHKPKRSRDLDVTTSIKPAENDASRLSLKYGDYEYGYAGKAIDDTSRYVLLSRGSGKDRGFVLEKLSGSHDFNLTSTPAERDTGKLAEKYQHLPEDNEGSIFGDDEELDDPVDESNPFDFRNHLKAKKAEPEPTGADTPRTSAGTPRPAARPAASTPLAPPKKPTTTSAAAQRKRKAAGPLKPNPKRVNAGAEPPVTASKKPKDVPSVRLDRKASVRRASLDDSGELILENETPVTERPPRAPGAMALALSGQLGAGPISLRSAASSPASRNASPMPARPDGVESPAEFELGESSPEAGAKKPRAQDPGDYFSNADEDDEDADADVEDLELPSPRQGRKSVGNAASSGGGAADEDYDMERELELALAQEDDGVVTQAAVLNESDEESEEE